MRHLDASCGRLPAVHSWLLRPLRAYPLDGAAATGIRRLTGYRLVNEGKIKGAVKLPPGAMLRERSDRAAPERREPDFDIAPNTPQDPYLKAGLDRIFGGRDPSYAVAILDISDPRKPLYASLRGDDKKIPGSVGKLCVVTGLFGALAATWPAIPDRQKVLRDTMVDADSFIFTDGKTVPIYNDGDPAVVNRQLRLGDRFSLWEWTDHMLSQSSNAAGSMVWKQAMLIRKFGKAYPQPKAEQDAFLKNTPRPELGKAGAGGARRAAGGIGNRHLAPAPGDFLHAQRIERHSRERQLRLSQRTAALAGEAGAGQDRGRVVEPRDQEAALFRAPALPLCVRARAGQRRRVFQVGLSVRVQAGRRPCKAYAGNVTNLMHSVAIVESGEKRYLVAMMSNVLRRELGAWNTRPSPREIEKLIQGRRAEFSAVINRQLLDQLGENLAAMLVFHQRHRDVLLAAMLHQRAVGVVFGPCAGFAVDLAARALQSLDELVMDAGLGEDFLHLRAVLGADQASLLQQHEESRHLQGGGAVRKVMQRIALPVIRGPAISFSQPQPAILAGS